MAPQISFFLLFGFITFINGKPAENRDNTYKIENFIKELSNQQGRYDIALSHHEDGPKTHHEDTAFISPHNDNSHEHGSSHESLGDQLNKNKLKSVGTFNANNVLIGSLLARDAKCNARCKDMKFIVQRNGKEYDNLEEVVEFLNELDKNFGDDPTSVSESHCASNKCDRDKIYGEQDRNNNNDRIITKNLRCKGKSCSESRDYRDDVSKSLKEYLRCLGDRCSRNSDNRDNRDNLRCNGAMCSITDDTDDGDSLRCSGDRCSRNRGDRDDLRCNGNRCGIIDDNNRDDSDNDLRCSGNRCNRNRDDRDNLRCNGNRCGIIDDNNRDDRNRDNRDDRDNDLRCSEDRCSRNRDDRDNLRCNGNRCGIIDDNNRDDRDDSNRDNRDDRDNDLRCSGDRCSRNRDDRDNLRCNGNRCGIIDDNDRYNLNNLRCRGKNCARSRYNYNNENVNYESQRLLNQYKLRENLDAVILDVADLDRLLSNLNVRKNKLPAKILENVDLDNLLSKRDTNDKKSDIEAVVYDLENQSDRQALSKQLKMLLA